MSVSIRSILKLLTTVPLISLILVPSCSRQEEIIVVPAVEITGPRYDDLMGIYHHHMDNPRLYEAAIDWKTIEDKLGKDIEVKISIPIRRFKIVVLDGLPGYWYSQPGNPFLLFIRGNGELSSGKMQLLIEPEDPDTDEPVFLLFKQSDWSLPQIWEV